MRTITRYFIYSLLLFKLSSCHDEDDDIPINKNPIFSTVNISFKFDSLQERLDNFGNISVVPLGHGAQSPQNSQLVIGYVELLSDSNIPSGSGVRILENYKVFNQSDTGYQCCNALTDESKSYSVQLSESVVPNTFKWIRIYFLYNHFNINYSINNSHYATSVACFLNKALTYHFEIEDTVYSNYSLKQNGEWFLEVDTPGYGIILHDTAYTASPNVLYQAVPTEANSCIVTCAINPPLFIGHPDTKSISISVSTNKSFEWVEHSDPAFFEPFDGDTIVDVGIRGIKVLQ